MRKELELMETIEKYLKGNLSEADKTAFEKRMNADPELMKEVELQEQLMKGIERAGLKQSILQGAKKFKFKRNLRNWGLASITVAVIAASSVFVFHSVSKDNTHENAANELPALNEQGEKLWSDADKYLSPQYFEVNAGKDTVLETKDGIVFAIPANSFLDASGKPVKGEIQLEVKEALNAAEIMKAGLNTKSGDKLLETGGMFYLNARQNDASLKIDPKNPVYAEIPADEIKPDMQLFEGKRMPDGTIDWVNPKPIQKDLIPVDILSLNFYPPGYLDSLNSWKYDHTNKSFTDSLYYSFASLFGGSGYNRELANGMDYDDRIKDSSALDIIAGSKLFHGNCAVCHSLGSNPKSGPGLAGVLTRVPSEEWMLKYIKNNELLIRSGDAYANKIKTYSPSAMPVYSSLTNDQIKNIIAFIKETDPSPRLPKTDNEFGFPGINPAKIKSIWNEKFQNTLIATREFEERLPAIFETCNEKVLDVYIENLDKSLSSIDSIVATWEVKGKEQFKNFAARGDGRVREGNKNVELLKGYYAEKTKLFTTAISKTVKEFWNKQTEADLKAFETRSDRSVAEMNRLSENFQREYDLNLNDAYRQLGKEKPQPLPPATYGFDVTNTGWTNVDKYVLESTINRTTLDYTDAQTGKKAVIKYEPLSVSVNALKNYDRVLVYLLPDELNSFMRVESQGGAFEEKLNELMIYKLVCIAYKGEESFYYSQDNVKPGRLDVTLVKTTNAEIQNNVNKLGNLTHVKAMNDELNYMAFEKEETRRQMEVAKIKELTDRIRPVIFPCDFVKSDSIAVLPEEGPAK